MAGFSEWLFGKPDKFKKIDTSTREQQAFHNNILAQAMGMSQGGGGYDLANQYFNNLLEENSQQAYDQFSAPYLQQFQEQILPQIAERFAGIGGQYGANSGALSSSGFAQALGGAGAGLQAQLAKLFSDLQGNAAQSQYGQYNQLSQTGLNYQPFGLYTQKGSQGMLGKTLEGALGSFGGPLFGQLGGMGGTGIANLFKKSSPIGGGIT
jgi:hypothetical protein